MNLSAVIRAWFDRLAAKKRERELAAAERRRNAIAKAIHDRKASHREWKPLATDLRRATLDSLRASVGRAM